MTRIVSDRANKTDQVVLLPSSLEDPTKAPPGAYRVLIWTACISISAFFAALIIAYVWRSGMASYWEPFRLPRVLWLSTALILLSSGTIQAACRSLKHSLDRQYVGWLSITAVLGLGFLVSQWFAWMQLSRQGVFLSSNPHSSFFYLLTAMHGLHLSVGLLALTYLLIRTRQRSAEEAAEARRHARAGAVGIYWYFMDGLWIYLFLLLFLWRSQ